jgi:type II secretory pathway component GspD/PulD (secretin)
MSPAVCGLFRPVVLLPQSLIERLTPDQLRAVLLHEFIHLRRRDIWVNCAQTLLQIVYWWHPLLWFANARVRQVREEAVDDAVMFALNEQAEIYAPTLLEVAKFAFNRPLATLGLVGILESRNALRQRIERLLNFTTPRRVGVSVMSVIGITAFTALAVPMGEPPARSSQGDEISDASNLINFHAKVNPEIFIRNLKARAGETMHSTNDDWNEILVSILDGFGVDCTPPRNITFDAATGEITTQNTSEALGIVDEVVKELSLPGGERILNPPHGLKQVLIEAQFYQMRAADFAKLNLDSGASHHDHDLSPWWGLSAGQLTDIRQRIEDLGVQSMSSPRIHTAHGITTGLSVGDGTNSIQLECVAFIHDHFVNLTALARTTGKYAPNGKGWPDFAGHTNCAIFSRVGAPDGGGVILRAEHAGTMPENELIVLLKSKILQPAVSSSASVTRGGSNGATTNTSVTPAADDKVSSLLADGKLLYELDKFDEAETKLNQALSIQPDNQAAHYYLSVIKQQRIKAVVDAHNGGGLKVIPNPYVRTNTIYTSAARQKLYEKLSEITFDKVSYPGLTLAEVIRNLRTETRQRDPEQKGINFILNRTKPGPPQTFDPRTGQPIAASTAPQEDVDLGTVMISLDPGLQNVRLMDVLEAIVKSSDHPIKYSLLDYGIEFSFKGPDVPELHTRTFKVDPNAFYHGIQNALKPAATQNAGGGNTGAGHHLKYGSVDSTTDIQMAVVNFFNAVGVNLSAPKSVFFNDRQGTLTAHATADDLDLIEQAIITLNTATPPAQSEMISRLNQQLQAATTELNYLTAKYTDEHPTVIAAREKIKILNAQLSLVTGSLNGMAESAAIEANGSVVQPHPKVVQTSLGEGLNTRTFKVNMHTFFIGGYQSGVFTNQINRFKSSAEIQSTLVSAFQKAGVDLREPKSLFFDNSKGSLTIRATEAELNLLENLISKWNTPPPEVTIKVRFVEVDAGNKSLNALLGGILTNAPSASTNSPILCGILTEPLFKSVLKALEKRDHADLLNEGEVTTLSGRRANIQVVDITPILTGLPRTNSSTPEVGTVFTTNGTIFDVAPYVGADGYTVQMTATPTATEFLGYANSETSSKIDKAFKSAHQSFPAFRIRTATLSATVWDQQTLVLGNLNDELVVNELNEEFRRPFIDTKKKQLFVFITPTIIDAVGNRIHSKDYYDGPTY